MTLVKNIKNILQLYPESRNNDTLLMFLYYKEHCKSEHKELREALNVVYSNWDKLQKEAKAESIFRARRKIQNQLGLYPALEDAIICRDPSVSTKFGGVKYE